MKMKIAICIFLVMLLGVASSNEHQKKNVFLDIKRTMSQKYDNIWKTSEIEKTFDAIKHLSNQGLIKTKSDATKDECTEANAYKVMFKIFLAVLQKSSKDLSNTNNLKPEENVNLENIEMIGKLQQSLQLLKLN